MIWLNRMRLGLLFRRIAIIADAVITSQQHLWFRDASEHNHSHHLPVELGHILQ